MAQPIIHCDPEIQGGVPVFYGTQVPVSLTPPCGTTNMPNERQIPACQRQSARRKDCPSAISCVDCGAPNGSHFVRLRWAKAKPVELFCDIHFPTQKHVSPAQVSLEIA